MLVEVAKTAGFCFGVKRAVDMVYKETSLNNPIYTLGSIIHNENVVNDLKERGVKVINDIKELNNISLGTIIIRSHGVGKNIYDLIEKKGLNIVDATCPFVKKIHNIVKEQSQISRNIIIIGNNKHPEVEGIKGWCNNNCCVIETTEEANQYCADKSKKVCIVSQTTFNYKKFQDLVEIIRKKGYDIIVVNTICNATSIRQIEAKKMANNKDVMIVIGGKNSSNTQKLYEICKNECEDTYYIQTLVDLDLKKFKSFCSVGITAGASTPHNIIKEVYTKMEDLMKEYLEKEMKEIHQGDLVNGTVIVVKENEIIVDIKYKSEGVISKNEYTNDQTIDLKECVHEGDEIQAKVLKLNDGEGQVVLSCKRLKSEKTSQILKEAFENKTPIKAVVTEVLNGGLSVIVDETKVFIPASLISDNYEKNLQKYAGQEIEFIITEFDVRGRRTRIIGDRKHVLLAKKEKLKEELFNKISVGMTVEGIVKNVTNFGAFVDIGGADGLLHISEMSWGRVENPSSLFKVGDKIKVFIKDIQNEKIALSLKFEDTDPWKKAEENYAKGTTVTGKVARMTDFGAFIELEPGIDALLHVSQISKERIAKPADVLSIGQEIQAKVVDFDSEKKKISLSMKELLKETTEE